MTIREKNTSKMIMIIGRRKRRSVYLLLVVT